MSNKTSDKDVANEEIINNKYTHIEKVAERIVNEFREKNRGIDVGVDFSEKTDMAYKILSLLAEREQKDKRIQELEEENYVQKIQIYENSIPKQAVIDLKNSITLDNTIVGGRRNAKVLNYGIKLGKIKACEELLEGRNENGFTVMQ